MEAKKDRGRKESLIFVNVFVMIRMKRKKIDGKRQKKK